MKLTRRNFLKSGPITAIALAVGLKPDRIIRSPVVDMKYFTKGCLSYTFTPDDDYDRQIAYIRSAWSDLLFLRGDPSYRAIGILGPPNE